MDGSYECIDAWPCHELEKVGMLCVCVCVCVCVCALGQLIL